MLRDRVRHALLAPFVAAFDVFLVLAAFAWLPGALLSRAYWLARADIYRIFGR